MRGYIDATGYKHYLRLTPLKYISAAFQELYDALAAQWSTEYTNPENWQVYGDERLLGAGEARWPYIQTIGDQPISGKIIDEMMVVIE